MREYPSNYIVYSSWHFVNMKNTSFSYSYQKSKSKPGRNWKLKEGIGIKFDRDYVKYFLIYYEHCHRNLILPSSRWWSK
ncbi:hypothetical protein EGR_07351 [Echinococcus granulosus]|uniref:Uncharacterized protein n=1 Tax=Echinococcus granulosus TaxID=6210 RepID=W6U8V3_ECHGR|nr:hypothetical protein EGR_07351 [Echinococcus granulosus]EUB57783.1 hypothetical protein EGR_07351 [Echinococcus granulosus]